jgi:hypothetical protein
MLVAILVAVPALFWARFHFTSLQVSKDPTSQLELSAAREEAGPLINALEKFHADNGLYPATLDRLSPGYLPAPANPHAFRYSARHSDWVFQSDACIVREKKLNGWILEPVKAYQKEVVQFKQECITGFRDYQLQSHDFPPDTASRAIERWAYYDSEPQHWSLGWCDHVSGSQGKTSELGTNGVCHSRPHGANDPAANAW